MKIDTTQNVIIAVENHMIILTILYNQCCDCILAYMYDEGIIIRDFMSIIINVINSLNVL